MCPDCRGILTPAANIKEARHLALAWNQYLERSQETTREHRWDWAGELFWGGFMIAFWLFVLYLLVQFVKWSWG